MKKYTYNMFGSYVTAYFSSKVLYSYVQGEAKVGL